LGNYNTASSEVKVFEYLARHRVADGSEASPAARNEVRTDGDARGLRPDGHDR